MKKRVDDILKAGNEWRITAEKLAQTLQALTEAIGKGNTQDLQPIKSELKRLATQTMRLARAFEAHRRVLDSITRKL